MNQEVAYDLERAITRWRSRLQRTGTLEQPDIEELESHLRDEIEALVSNGLKPDEAFLIGVRRIGSTSEVAREFYKINGGRLWKQLGLPNSAATDRDMRVSAEDSSGREFLLVALLAIGAALAAQIPYLFGLSYLEDLTAIREVPFVIFPFLGAYVAYRRGISMTALLVTAVAYLAAFVLMHAYPFSESADTLSLSTLHLALLFWALFGLLYIGSSHGTTKGYEDFLTYSGEVFIYTVLIGLGGMVLIATSLVIFDSIGIDIGAIVERHVVAGGAMASIVVATYLVEAKRSVIENMAPVLAKLFVPLFSVVLLAFLVSIAFRGTSPAAEPQLLTVLDLLLFVVLAMVFYTISSRHDVERVNHADYLNIALLLIATVVDAISLVAIVDRLSDFGFSPNKTAALGQNVLMLIHLIALDIVYLRFLMRRSEYRVIEKTVIRAIPIYAGWFAVVVIVFPPLFGWI